MPWYLVEPQSKRLTLPCGEWVDVKARLNHGEYQDVMERCYRVGDDGTVSRVPFRWAEAMLCAYLIDWSLEDLRIRGSAPADIEQALRLLDQDLYTEIRDAVDAHVAELNRARDEKKRPLTGAGVS